MRSLYELLHPSGVVAKQRFVDNFSGDALNERWNSVDLQGTGGSGSMNDSIDGGYNITTDGTDTNDLYGLNFNDKMQYDVASSGVIAVTKASHTTDIVTSLGIYDNGFTGTDNYYRILRLETGATNEVQLKWANGTVQNSTTLSSLTIDTNWHNHQVILTGGILRGWEDGTFSGVGTTSLPTSTKGQPIISIQNRDLAQVRSMDIRYFEAYNL